jgi:pimeloyl-ACP methyl ester carboxylesterase
MQVREADDTVVIDGIDVPVCTAGPADGELVVLLHGFPQTPAAWSAVLPPLAAAGYRVVALTQRGYVAGLPAAPADVRLDRVAADVLAVADDAGAGRFHVVGHDWGAMAAWALAAAQPERVASLTALSVPHPGAMVAALPGVQAVRSAYTFLFRLPQAPEAVLGAAGGRFFRSSLERSGLPPALARAYVDQLVGGGVLTGALNWYRGNDPGVLRSVPPVEVPTLFLWGRHDPWIGRRAAEGCTEFVNGPFRFVELDDGHWLPERQADAVVSAVLGHLSRAGASPRA